MQDRRRSHLVLSSAIFLGFATSTHAAIDCLVDPSYAGVNGQPYNGHSGADNSVAAALGSGGVGSGASAADPNRIFFAPGTYNVGTAALSNSKSNLVLIGTSGNADDVVITSTLG